MLCREKDELVDLLKDYGYLPVALPRKGIVPMQVIELSQGSYKQTTTLSELFIPHKDYLPPALPKLRPALDQIKGKQTNEVASKVGLSLTEKWIKALGGGDVGLKSAYDNAEKFIFEFNYPKVRELDWAKLDKYLNNAKIDDSARSYLEKIRNNELYIIVSTLLSSSFTVQAIDNSGNRINAQAGVSQIGEVSVSRHADSFNNTKISYKGKEDIVFGIKAVRLSYEQSAHDQDYFFNIMEAKRAVLKSSDEKLPATVLSIDGNFIEL